MSTCWALAAVGSGLGGTTLVVMWLFGANSIDGIESRLPAPVVASVNWLESHGWGQRVLLTDRPGGFRANPQYARAGGAAPGGVRGSLGFADSSFRRFYSAGGALGATRFGTTSALRRLVPSTSARRASSSTSRTRGLSTGEPDARAGRERPDFHDRCHVTSVCATWRGREAHRVRDQRHRQQNAIRCCRLPARRYRARHGDVAERSRRQDGVLDAIGSSGRRLRDHRALSRHSGFSGSQSESIRQRVDER